MKTKNADDTDTYSTCPTVPICPNARENAICL